MEITSEILSEKGDIRLTFSLENVKTGWVLNRSEAEMLINKLQASLNKVRN